MRTRTSVVGGDSSSRSTQARHPHAVGGLGDRQRLSHDLVGIVVMVAERLAVGGGDHQPTEGEGGVDDAQARRRLEGEGVGERAVVDDEVDRPVRVVGVAPPVERRCAAGTSASICPGARIVKRMPSSASTRSTKSFTAVSGSHMPSGRRPNRWAKSRIPHRTWVRTSRSLQSGRMAWPYAWAMARPGRAIGVDDAAVHVGMVRLEPREQRGPDVERQLLEGAELGVGSVALGGDALVPVVERRGARLLGHDPGPGVLTGRLVEVPVQHQRGASEGDGHLGAHRS